MSMTTHPSLEHPDSFGTASAGKLGMWFFLLMDGLSFATIFIGAGYLRTNGAPWPQAGSVLNIPLTAFNTFVLMFSSYTMMQALIAVQNGQQKKFVQFMWATLALGGLFLGIQAYEYYHFIAGSPELAEKLAAAGIAGNHFWPLSSIYSGCFFGATGYHGLHVLAGLIFMLYILQGAISGKFNAKNHGRVEVLTLYWHFIDLMWMFVFVVVYLM